MHGDRRERRHQLVQQRKSYGGRGPSVGGTAVAVMSVLHPGPGIKPTQVRFGGPNNENPESAYWYGFKVETTTTLTESQVKDHLVKLDFFLIGGTVTPGGDV